MAEGDGSASRDDSSIGWRHREALVAFLGAGLSPAPERSTLVSAPAEARREVARCQARHIPIDPWLADQVRLRGVRENAAILAMLGSPERRVQAADLWAGGKWLATDDEDLGKVFVARIAPDEFADVLEQAADLLDAEFTRWQPASSHGGTG